MLLAAAGGWEVSAEDIEICQRPDGSDWLLGEGRYGQVFKALKGGVQVRPIPLWTCCVWAAILLGSSWSLLVDTREFYCSSLIWGAFICRLGDVDCESSVQSGRGCEKRSAPSVVAAPGLVQQHWQ